MKKLVSLICIIFLCVSILLPASAAEHFTAQLTYDGKTHDYTGAYFNVVIDGKEVTAPIPPVVLENGRSIACVREIFESLGAEVLWTSGTPSRVLICHKNDVISLALDDNIAYVNGKEVEMEVPAKLVVYNDIAKTMVPVRFVAQTLGMEVEYIKATDTIMISSPKPTATPTPKPTPTPTPTPEIKYVNNIKHAHTDTSLTMEINLDKPYDSYNHFTLDDPLRIVLDIDGFSVEKLQTSYEIDSFVERIRTSYYYGAARIVLDMKNLSNYNVTASNDKKTITVIANGKSADAEKPDTSNKGYKIVIDPGHGGSDPGAIGYNNDGSEALRESAVTLPVANMVYQILKENGVNVYYTRNTDVYVTLAERAEFANDIGASLFVSIHCNAFTTSDVQGSLVMHHTSKDTSEYGVSGKDLAENIMTYLPDALDTQNRGRVDGSAMYVIRKVDMPSVIVEMAFITNPEDRKKLGDKKYQQKAAEAIAQGIMDTIPDLKK